MTREYFSRLYDHSHVPDLPKPWLNTPSVKEVRGRVTDDPFIWPIKASLADFRAMLRQGNSKPSPGPDGWKKLEGSPTLQFPCELAYGMAQYLFNVHVAAQPGVQTRDLMSYLSGVRCWANRHKQQVFTLKCDQMKGFDYLSPKEFYDPIHAYGLPKSIIDLDYAAQHQTQCYIRTPYGVSDPIVVSGLNKQGGATSPLKLTFTTSLGHYFLNDLLSKDPDALVVTTSSMIKDDPHLMDAKHKLLVAMVEATDDSYIFSKSLESLQHNALAMERFQYAYGWLMQWAKSKAYVLAASENYPDTVKFQSVSMGRGVNPLDITEHDVVLIRDDLDFLQTKVNDPVSRFAELKDFIESFQFLMVIGRLLITLIRKIVSQNIVSRCHALLSLQPVKQSDAEALDRLIIRKVHGALGFPFQPSTSIATLPVSYHGFDFPSIARINTGIAVNGIGRDLNHHIRLYQTMAHIMRMDWTCEWNNCQYLLDAQKVLKDLSLSLRLMDQSGIIEGIHRFMGVSLRSLHLKGIRTLKDFGEWTINQNGCIGVTNGVAEPPLELDLTFPGHDTQKAMESTSTSSVSMENHRSSVWKSGLMTGKMLKKTSRDLIVYAYAFLYVYFASLCASHRPHSYKYEKPISLHLSHHNTSCLTLSSTGHKPVKTDADRNRSIDRKKPRIQKWQAQRRGIEVYVLIFGPKRESADMQTTCKHDRVHVHVSQLEYECDATTTVTMPAILDTTYH
ncbi:uncharacterized protein LACBIDRAFT_321369 [Laccaria bicolor S238N-H82]|uniref:Predicted protein n=1 Tax=Laccaria bicolor (strain S238N-H82 / ATCC MYA-4686) TaxID=486041 RepID=B0CPY9_LACBS|nr:uncharacterized protein LACBIDRAFT_321369 [Laccaria bicolor S238N-H82]EDR16147.1 predicted protein [Laccaria bicolor S238N-H82]|eukprot:XP_001874355.1 predicted protein [Laccaria bicolor S238N-H82]